MTTQTADIPRVSSNPTGNESARLALAVAEKLAAEIGYRIVQEEGSRRVLLARQTYRPDVIVWLSIYADSPNTGHRVTIATHYRPDMVEANGRVSGERYEINVTATRSAKALGNDVARRLLPDAEYAAIQFADQIAERQISDTNRDRAVEHLLAAVEPGHLGLDEVRAADVRPGDGRRFYLRSDLSPYGDADVSPDGSRVRLELRALTPAQAVAVLRALGATRD